VAFEFLDVVAVLSTEVLERVVAFFFGTQPILSSSADWSSEGKEGFLNMPFTEARAFSGRTETVLLPELTFGIFAEAMTGLGERCCDESPTPVDGSSEDAGAVPRALEGAFDGSTAIGRLSGGLFCRGACGGLNVVGKARKSCETD
jgi:hypothetical protein